MRLRGCLHREQGRDPTESGGAVHRLPTSLLAMIWGKPHGSVALLPVASQH